MPSVTIPSKTNEANWFSSGAS